MPAPIYTADNCVPAFQLRWSLTLFARRELPSADQWLEPLKAVVEKDGVRILEHCFKPPNSWFFLLSTLPNVAPPQIVKSIKGRLQHLLRPHVPQAFQRNFSLTSLGDAKTDVVENYVAAQLSHHRMADKRVEDRLEQFRFQATELDLDEPHFSSHGRYIYNLHVVLVYDFRCSIVSQAELSATMQMIIRASQRKAHRLSRAALLADHVHLTIGCPLHESPEQIALGYLNNLAFAHRMTPVFSYGYYVGTFGPYDMGAVWSHL